MGGRGNTHPTKGPSHRARGRRAVQRHQWRRRRGWRKERRWRTSWLLKGVRGRNGGGTKSRRGGGGGEGVGTRATSWPWRALPLRLSAGRPGAFSASGHGASVPRRPGRAEGGLLAAFSSHLPRCAPRVAWLYAACNGPFTSGGHAEPAYAEIDAAGRRGTLWLAKSVWEVPEASFMCVVGLLHAVFQCVDCAGSRIAGQAGKGSKRETQQTLCSRVAPRSSTSPAGRSPTALSAWPLCISGRLQHILCSRLLNVATFIA